MGLEKEMAIRSSFRLAAMLELVDNDTVRRFWLLLSSLLSIFLTVRIKA